MTSASIRRFFSEIKVTYVLLGVNVFVFIVTIALGGIGHSTNIDRFGVLIPQRIYEGEYWRLVWTMFLHADIFHILFNSYALYTIGSYVENYYGSAKLITVYILTGLSASLFSLAFTQSPTVGASGAIFGLLGLLVGNNFRKNIYAMDLPVDGSQLLVIVGVNLFLGFTIPNIDNSAHIGGLLSGIVFGYVINPALTFYTSRLEAIRNKSLFFLSLIILSLSVILAIINFFKF